MYKKPASLQQIGRILRDKGEKEWKEVGAMANNKQVHKTKSTQNKHDSNIQAYKKAYYWNIGGHRLGTDSSKNTTGELHMYTVEVIMEGLLYS